MIPPPPGPEPPTTTPTRRQAPPWHPEAWAGFVVRLTRTEVTGGLVLVAGVAGALLWANLAPGAYTAFFDHHLGRSGQGPDVTSVINRGLMTVFFLAVGLEIGQRAGGRLAGREPQRRTAGGGRAGRHGRGGPRLPGCGRRPGRGTGRGGRLGGAHGHRRGLHPGRPGPGRQPGPGRAPGVRPGPGGGRRRGLGGRAGHRRLEPGVAGAPARRSGRPGRGGRRAPVGHGGVVALRGGRRRGVVAVQPGRGRTHPGRGVRRDVGAGRGPSRLPVHRARDGGQPPVELRRPPPVRPGQRGRRPRTAPSGGRCRAVRSSSPSSSPGRRAR